MFPWVFTTNPNEKEKKNISIFFIQLEKFFLLFRFGCRIIRYSQSICGYLMIFSLHFTWIELYSINFKSCCIEGQHRIRYGEQAPFFCHFILLTGTQAVAQPSS